jgi:hypothetical protein
MLNDAAKKVVARAARVAAHEARDRVARGANADQLVVEAWEFAQAQQPEMREWSSAKAYFEAVFLREIDQ